MLHLLSLVLRCGLVLLQFLMISSESEVHASSFFIHVSSRAAVKSIKGLEMVFGKPVEKDEGETGEG